MILCIVLYDYSTKLFTSRLEKVLAAVLQSYLLVSVRIVLIQIMRTAFLCIFCRAFESAWTRRPSKWTAWIHLCHARNKPLLPENGDYWHWFGIQCIAPCRRLHIDITGITGTSSTFINTSKTAISFAFSRLPTTCSLHGTTVLSPQGTRGRLPRGY
jgi:type IV secretory pathway VirB6-like protein